MDLRLADADGHRGNAVERENLCRDALRQRLNQVLRLAFHHGLHDLVGAAIVDRQLKGVAPCRVLQTGLQLHVDEKLLTLRALLRQHPMVGEKPHPCQHQTVRHSRRVLTAANASSRSTSARRPAARTRSAVWVRYDGSLMA